MSGTAFGAPGTAPTWTSSAKDLVTTALGPSRVWATVGHGVLNEVYWPTTGRPQVRDLGFIVAGEGYWAEVKREMKYEFETPAPYLPLPRVVHVGERYRLSVEFVPDPARDVLLVAYGLEGADLKLYVLLAPHLGSDGWGNTAWVTDALFACKGDHSLCLLADSGFSRASAGYVGRSDGWQDFAAHGAMTYSFDQAVDGNVALTGELASKQGVLALAFAESPEGARTLARSSTVEGYRAVRARFVAGWETWQASCLRVPELSPRLAEEACLSATVLKVHEDRTYPGAVVASLSIPWGQSRQDDGGYHLVWPRDAVETGLALAAVGDLEGARRMLGYLAATQHEEGHWPQNFYPDGRPFWTGVQLDEVGFPVLLAAKLDELGEPRNEPTRAMVRKAVGFLVRNGPLSPQDRWEENPGASPFSLAVEVAALVAGSSWLDPGEREYVLELADCWNERVEEWTYVEGTALALKQGVAGYYVRIGPPPQAHGLRGRVEVRNRGDSAVPAQALVALDFLYLARLGLRSADDERITGTLRVADALLRVETPAGPAYHRYNGDGYGEHNDGSPFDGSGTGRAWPLLTGERGHGALLARAGLGCRRHTRARPLPRQADRFSHATPMGACRVPEARRRESFWPAGRAVAGRSPALQEATGGSGLLLALASTLPPSKERERFSSRGYCAVCTARRLRRLAGYPRPAVHLLGPRYARGPARTGHAQGVPGYKLHPLLPSGPTVGGGGPHGAPGWP
jgi:glucoamylase